MFSVYYDFFMSTPMRTSELTKKERETALFVQTRFEASKSNKVDVLRKAIDYERIYNTWIPRNPKESKEGKRARVATPLGFAIVEQQTAKQKRAILPSSPHEPYVRVLPQSNNDVESAPMAEKWLNWRLELANYRRKTEMALRHFNIFGMVPGYPYYDYRVKTRKLRLPIDMMNPLTGMQERLGLGPPTSIDQVLFRGPNYDIGHISDFYPDPSAEIFDSEGMDWVVRRRWDSYRRLKIEVESNPELYNKKVFEKISPLDTPSITDDPFITEITRYHQYPYDFTPDSFSDIVEVWEYLSADRIITVINHDYPIMDIEDPFWLAEVPCFVGVRLPMSRYPWGKGSIEPIERTIAHIVSNRNMRLDTVRMNLQPPWIALKNSVTNPEALYSTEPNRIIEVMRKDAVEKIKIDDTTSQSFAEEDILRQDVDLSSNSFGFSSGNIPANIRSATQQLSLMEMVAERDQMDIEAFESSFIKPLSKWFIALGQMFTTSAEIVRFDEEDGPAFPVLQPYDLLGEFDYKIVGAARVIPKAVEAQQRQVFISGILPMLENPQGFTDVALKLHAVLARDYGYYAEAKILSDAAKMMRLLRYVQGGVLNLQSINTGALTQRAQGPAGARGQQTSPENIPLDLEALARSSSEANTQEDIAAI